MSQFCSPHYSPTYFASRGHLGLLVGKGRRTSFFSRVGFPLSQLLAARFYRKRKEGAGQASWSGVKLLVAGGEQSRVAQ